MVHSCNSTALYILVILVRTSAHDFCCVDVESLQYIARRFIPYVVFVSYRWAGSIKVLYAIVTIASPCVRLGRTQHLPPEKMSAGGKLAETTKKI